MSALCSLCATKFPYSIYSRTYKQQQTTWSDPLDDTVTEERTFAGAFLSDYFEFECDYGDFSNSKVYICVACHLAVTGVHRLRAQLRATESVLRKRLNDTSYIARLRAETRKKREQKLRAEKRKKRLQKHLDVRNGEVSPANQSVSIETEKTASSTSNDKSKTRRSSRKRKKSDATSTKTFAHRLNQIVDQSTGSSLHKDNREESADLNRPEAPSEEDHKDHSYTLVHQHFS